MTFLVYFAILVSMKKILIGTLFSLIAFGAGTGLASANESEMGTIHPLTQHGNTHPYGPETDSASTASLPKVDVSELNRLIHSGSASSTKKKTRKVKPRKKNRFAKSCKRSKKKRCKKR